MGSLAELRRAAAATDCTRPSVTVPLNKARSKLGSDNWASLQVPQENTRCRGSRCPAAHCQPLAAALCRARPWWAQGPPTGGQEADLRQGHEQAHPGASVTRLDRLARSTRDLLNTLDAVGKAGAGFRSLADAWADTTTPHGRLLLTILGGLAEFERELIRARTDEGRQRAKARCTRFGRKLKLTRHQILEALARREAGEALADIGRSYNVSHSTISRLRAEEQRPQC
jgi:hypothetical protein